MKNKLLLFIKNPLFFVLRCFGYEVVAPSLIFQHMVDFTHSKWIEDLQNQNRVQDFEYKLWSE
jgi:hypothetical protein